MALVRTFAATALVFLVAAAAAPSLAAPTGAGLADFATLRAAALAPPQHRLTLVEAAAVPPEPGVQSGIGPGSALQQSSGGSGFICTAAFLVRDATTGTYYLSTAGHCLVRDETDATPYNGHANPDKVHQTISICVSGCVDNALGIGTYVDLSPTDGYHPVAFAQSGGVGADFGLIEIPGNLRSQLRPAMPMWGGPTAYDPEVSSNYVVYFGHGSYCCPGTGAVASRTPADQGRAGVVQSLTDDSFEALGWSSGGDSGSGVNFATAGGDVLAGTTALGVLTHGSYVAHPAASLPLFSGTTLGKGFAMVRDAIGLPLELVPEGDPLPEGATAAPPTLAILKPAAGAKLAAGDIVTIHGLIGEGDAAPPAGSVVQVSIDDPTFAEDNRVPVSGDASWNATWFLSGEVPGGHTIYARLVSGPRTLAEDNRTVTIEGKTGSKPAGSASSSASLSGGAKASKVSSSPSDSGNVGAPGLEFVAAAAALALAALVRRRR